MLTAIFLSHILLTILEVILLNNGIEFKEFRIQVIKVTRLATFKIEF